MKRFIAILLAMVMVLGLGTMAMAAAPSDKVQVNNMMVDASKVDLASFDLTAEEESSPVETFAATATYSDLDVNTNLPPIKKILIQGFEEKDISGSSGMMQGNAIYTLTVPAGTTAAKLKNKVVTFELGGNSTTPDGSAINLIYNGTTYSATAGGSISITMTLTPNVSTPFTATWTALNSDGSTTAKNRSCQLTAYVPDNNSNVSLSSLTIGGTPATISSTTVGGVTNYVCVAELENVTSLTGLEVVAKLGSGHAEATLGGIDGVKDEDDDTIVTFSNVNLTSSKNLIITNGPDSNTTQYSRTYQVSASIVGQSITVHVAFRGYLADQWYNGEKDYYDYVASGYGDGSSITDEDENERITSAIATMLGLKGENYPESIDATTGRAIFSDNSYIEVTLTPTAATSSFTVYDALIGAINAYNDDTHRIEQTGAENNYVSAIAFGVREDVNDPFDMYEIGEFDCGSASGWMYTARTSRTDVTSALPNTGLQYWPVSNGMYIDWYYTAAYGADFGYSIFDL